MADIYVKRHKIKEHRKVSYIEGHRISGICSNTTAGFAKKSFDAT